jgi:hypothetical protein
MTEKIVPKRAAFRRACIQTVRAGAYTQSQASGLDRAEAQARLQKTGPNALPEKKANPPGCVSGPF